MKNQRERLLGLLGLFGATFLVAQNAPPLSVTAERRSGTIRIDLIGDPRKRITPVMGGASVQT